MSSKELYRRFTNLCQRWPKDDSKVGRDYAEYFRSQIGKHFPHGELGQLHNPIEVEGAISALERLANNHYYNENPLKRASASGLEAWACHEAISNEGIRQLQETDEASLLSRLKSRLGMRFLASKSDYKVADTYGGALESKKSDKEKS